MARWSPALRIARRDLVRHRVRTALTLALVALPVLVGVAAAEVAHNSRYEGERQARIVMGGADALVEVSPFERVRVGYRSEGDLVTRAGSFSRDRDGHRRPVRRDPAGVDLSALLPPGSRTTPASDFRDVVLATGGIGHVVLVDLRDPMTTGLGELESGRAPTAADEVAVNAPAAAELGLLRGDGTPRPDATLGLADGTQLRVVGVVGQDLDESFGGGMTMVAAPTSGLRGHERNRYLVDLPASAGDAPHALAASLARHGVAMLPRDVLLHPQDWRVREPAPSPVDASSVAMGALVVLFGLVEVVLIVGSAFAVGARRQVRDLGLLAASGGAPSDVRRVLLGQGLVLGVGASVLGAAGGIGVFLAGVPVYERFAHTHVWTRDVDWVVVAALTLLGSLTGVVAALVPAWSIGRLTPLAALSGRFPLRAGESHAHRPAFVLTGTGLLALVVAGWWTAREYAPPPVTVPEQQMFASQPSVLPLVLGGFGLLMMIGGVVWSAPYVVRRVAGVGRLLPLSGRYAFRDAARHRFRTAAAAVALTVTVAGAVFAGFVMQAVAATVATESNMPPHSLMIYVDDYESVRSTPQRADQLVATVARVVGPVTAHTAYRLSRRGAPESELTLAAAGGGYQTVSAVDPATMRYFAGPHGAAALRVFESGGLVTLPGARIRDGVVTAAIRPGARKPGNQLEFRAVTISPSRRTAQGELSQAWVSRSTAQRRGLDARPGVILAVARRPITTDDLTRLSVYGIDTFTPDVDLAQQRWLQLGVLGAAGLVTLLVVGIAVALSAAEGRADQATMAAVGAGPWRRRSLGAMHGLFLGLVGALLGVVIGLPAGVSLMQVDGVPGVQLPWWSVACTVLAVPPLAWCAGWLTTPGRLPLVRRTG
jgi:putative ABC transport system permease protein